MELQHKQSKAVAVTCMAFQPNNVNNFAVGAEDGSVYSACRHGRYHFMEALSCLNLLGLLLKLRKNYRDLQ